MIELKPIDSSNWLECINLEITEKQHEFVAENWYSLLEANYEKDLYPFGIYVGDDMVGFIMYGKDCDFDIPRWEMCRLMVDQKHQKKGYGSEAVKKILEIAKEKHNISEFYTSADPQNKVAIKMYESLGFKKTGEIVWDEAVLKIEL